MNKRKVTLAAAAAGVLTGAAGLSLLAMPAGAGQPPSLPSVSAETLVEQVLTSKPSAFGGTVEVDNKLGLPAIAEVPQLADGKHSARIWTDGNGKLRLALPNGQSEQTIVDDGTTTWSWNSADNEVTKSEHKADQPKPDKPDSAEQKAIDPATAAKEIVTMTKEFSDISVDGTARVANRAAYELVLTPKATEKTLVREVRIAVDSELKMPLRVVVLTNGTAEPVGTVGFSQINVGPQDSSLFQFTPPANAKVTTPEAKESKEADRRHRKPEAGLEQALQGKDPQIIGSGWDTVIGARIPAEAMTQVPAEAQGLVDRFTKKVSGSWGSGKLFNTKVATILIADDGRVVAGAVPEQVLFDAIGQVK